MKVDVFSYGSNMCLPRIRARVPSAEFVCTGILERHELRFHKLGLDGSAKADAFHTGDERQAVWGVVFSVHVEEKPTLDACESLGIGYDERQVTIKTGDHVEELVEASVYVARPEKIVTGVSPYCWYREFVLAGARQHGAPDDYVKTLEAVAAMTDPDAARLAENRRLIVPAGGA
jgi:hypothetical protein